MKSVVIAIATFVALSASTILMGAAARDPGFHAPRAGTFCPAGEECAHGQPAANDPFEARFGRRAALPVGGFTQIHATNPGF